MAVDPFSASIKVDEGKQDVIVEVICERSIKKALPLALQLWDVPTGVVCSHPEAPTRKLGLGTTPSLEGKRRTTVTWALSRIIFKALPSWGFFFALFFPFALQGSRQFLRHGKFTFKRRLFFLFLSF